VSQRDIEPPRVTVSNPFGPASPSPERPPVLRSRRAARRGLPAVVVALVAAVVVARLIGASSAAGAPLLQLNGDQAVYLSLSPTGPGNSRMQVPFQLRNRGRAAITVLGAKIPGSLLGTSGPADPVAPGGLGQLVLEQAVTCRTGQPPVVPGAGTHLSLRVRSDGVERTVALVLPREPRSSVVEELDRLCGWVPVPEAVRFVSGPAHRAHGRWLIPLTMFNSSAQVVRLTGVGAPSPALRLALRDGRGPVELAPATGPPATARRAGQLPAPRDGGQPLGPAVSRNRAGDAGPDHGRPRTGYAGQRPAPARRARRAAGAAGGALPLSPVRPVARAPAARPGRARVHGWPGTARRRCRTGRRTATAGTAPG